MVLPRLTKGSDAQMHRMPGLSAAQGSCESKGRPRIHVRRLSNPNTARDLADTLSPVRYSSVVAVCVPAADRSRYTVMFAVPGRADVDVCGTPASTARSRFFVRTVVARATTIRTKTTKRHDVPPAVSWLRTSRTDVARHPGQAIRAEGCRSF